MTAKPNFSSALLALLTAGLCATAGAAEGPTLRDRLLIDAKPKAMLDQEREFFGLADAAGDEQSKAAFLPAMQWPASIKKLRVCFFGGSEEARQAIRDIASDWEGPDNSIRFDWGKKGFRDCDTATQKRTMHIRIGFDEPGWFSAYGLWALFFSEQSKKSMNLNGFDNISREEAMTGKGGWNAGTIRHEFGHAIGFIHEHQSPKSSCENDFDWDVIYKAFSQGGDGDEGWDKDKVDSQLRQWSDPDIISTKFDPTSVMKYFYSPEMFKNGKESTCFSAGDNNKISELDRKAVSFMYPPDASARMERYGGVKAAILQALEKAEEGGAAKGVKLDYAAMFDGSALPVDEASDDE